MKTFGDEEADVSKFIVNTSRAIAADLSFQRKENNSPFKRFYRNGDTPNYLDKGLSFEQAVNTLDGICPCCKQTLPPDRKLVINDAGKTIQNAPSNNRVSAQNTSIVNFSKNLSNDPTTPNPVTKSSSKTEENKSESKGKRRRKNKAQVKKLEEAFALNPHWTNEDVDKLSRDLKLDKAQVYKWNWDQKKKLNILPSKVYVVQMPNDGTHVDANGKAIKDGRQMYVKSIQDVIRLQSLASTHLKDLQK